MTYSLTKRSVMALSISLVSLLASDNAFAQQTAYQRRLSAARQQNAFQQQQLAAQLAVQRTNVLVQSAARQGTSAEPSGLFQTLDFQQQTAALQVLLQQTIALQQAQFPTTGLQSQSVLQQINSVQGIIQQSAQLQRELQAQTVPITPIQVQALFREATSLMTLLATPPPTAATSRQRRP